MRMMMWDVGNVGSVGERVFRSHAHTGCGSIAKAKNPEDMDYGLYVKKKTH